MTEPSKPPKLVKSSKHHIPLELDNIEMPAVSAESGEPPSQEEPLCTHEHRAGGNDYLQCLDCGISWDYRKEATPEPSPRVAGPLPRMVEEGEEIELPDTWGQGPQPDVEGMFNVLALRKKLRTAESHIAELERALREIGNAVGAPLPDYYGAGPQREAFLNTARTISDLCAAALKEKQ